MCFLSLSLSSVPAGNVNKDPPFNSRTHWVDKMTRRAWQLISPGRNSRFLGCTYPSEIENWFVCSVFPGVSEQSRVVDQNTIQKEGCCVNSCIPDLGHRRVTWGASKKNLYFSRPHLQRSWFHCSRWRWGNRTLTLRSPGFHLDACILSLLYLILLGTFRQSSCRYFGFSCLLPVTLAAHFRWLTFRFRDSSGDTSFYYSTYCTVHRNQHKRGLKFLFYD